MKLIASLTSPFARKVRVVLAEKHIECELVVDIPWNEDSHVPDYNPLGKIPVLLLDDGTALFDSRVIVEYLDNVSPVGRMFPQDAHSRILVKRWEALADGICDAAAAIFIEKKRAQDQQNPEWIIRQEGKIFRGLETLAEYLGEKPWCMETGFSLADIAVGCALGYLDLRFAEKIKWREGYPNLARLATKLSSRASFNSTEPPV
ncbi:glutathione S-transferase family protein [Sulfuriferula multivorans]|uniref:Glutathione S-transferase family protein n=1 Tax=Sulfuriferula multivorans TaxID=1559896 RepID=A0A401JFX5_9PROT|nr:glutathione S-transferase [Sulfuriferula multivorans]GBL46512.1 glutathione S-transferase family protein [Sulfuriferula multivorans]